jgi:hypothetical protein
VQLVTGLMMQSMLQLLLKQMMQMLLLLLLLLRRPAHLLLQHRVAPAASATPAASWATTAAEESTCLCDSQGWSKLTSASRLAATAGAAASGSALWLALQCHMLTLCQLLRQTCAVASLR